MAEKLRNELAQDTEAHAEAVRELLRGFRETQQSIADDLRAAAQRWQALAGQRQGSTGERPSAASG